MLRPPPVLMRSLMLAMLMAPSMDTASASGPPASHLRIDTGEVVLITVQIDDPDSTVVGRLEDRTIGFFRMNPSGQYGALIGIDLANPAADTELTVLARNGQGERVVERYRISVHHSKFGTQKLTLPKDRVDLDDQTLKRVRIEQKKMLQNMSGFTESRLWNGTFIMPTEGTISGTFGQNRIINGEPRNPHTGEDIYADHGNPVLAPNDGVVRLTGDFFFSGKSIVVDHGLGLFTMYFHLSEILVGEGESVSKGQIIGRVGATGRVTGPHLHWGARLNGARVNPLSLLKIPYAP